MLDKSLEKLIESAPLAIIVVGVILFLLGASGGIQVGNVSFQVAEQGWRLSLGIVGAILVFSGMTILVSGDMLPIKLNYYIYKTASLINTKRKTNNTHKGFF